jgi:phosphoribosylaminoimidazolecarboxamide formyltransferase/IMP cyclohydrolase
VVVKHTNPAGVAVGSNVADAFERAWEGDSLAAFGGVVAIHGTLDADTASLLADRFVEVVIAMDAEGAALRTLAAKKGLRVITAPQPSEDGLDYRRVDSGFLAQTRDRIEIGQWDVVSRRKPDLDEMKDLEFAWKVAAHVKSNAIVIAADGAAVGVGAGDQSRVGAAERAIAKAGDRARGAVAASDAFFPFRDGVDTLAQAGVRAVVEPGGSVRDEEVIAAADEHDIVLVFTGRRHFRH